jgi:hypothetical protein
VTRHHSCRVTPFGHPRIHARLTAPRGISQPPTSFIGSRCQGIHHAPLNTYKHKNQSFSKIAQKNTPPTRATHPLDARNHYPQIKHHTPPPRWSDKHLSTNQSVVSGPNSVPAIPPPPNAGKIVVAHPVGATTAHNPSRLGYDTASQPFSWCSLERR